MNHSIREPFGIGSHPSRPSDALRLRRDPGLFSLSYNQNNPQTADLRTDHYVLVIVCRTYMYTSGVRSYRLLKEARRRAGLSQSELGERAGKAPSAISRWERAGSEPSLETLRALIRAAGFDLMIGLVPADDHDLALIRRSLGRSPEQRLAEMVEAVRALASMAAARG